MTQTLTTPTARPTATPVTPVAPATSRPTLRERLRARRARNSAFAREVTALPATRGVGIVIPR